MSATLFFYIIFIVILSNIEGYAKGKGVIHVSFDQRINKKLNSGSAAASSSYSFNVLSEGNKSYELLSMTPADGNKMTGSYLWATVILLMINSGMLILLRGYGSYDNIIYKGVTVSDFALGGTKLSDHYGLYCNI